MSERVEVGGQPDTAVDEDGAGEHKVKLAVAWTVVGVPLAYGVVSVIIRASQLFTQ